MKPWLYVGAKVVCVDASDRLCTRPICDQFKLDGLAEGITYTIREVLIHPWGTLAIRLEEIERPILRGDPYELGYNAGRFRPVSTINTDEAVAKLAKMTEPSEQSRQIADFIRSKASA